MQDARTLTVVVEWGGISDVEGWEEKRESTQVLKRHLWNKDKEGAWRIDIKVDLCEAYESDDDSQVSESDADSEGDIGDELSEADRLEISDSESSTDYGDSDSDSNSDGSVSIK